MSPREEGAAGGETGRAAAKGSVPPVRVGTATPRKPPTLAVVTSCGTRSEKDADANAAANAEANAKAYAGVALDRSPSSNAAAALLVGMARMTKHRREDPFGSSDYVGCAVGHSVSHSVGHSVGHTTSGTGAFGSLHPVPPEPRGGAGNPPGPLHVPGTIQGTLQGIPSRPPCALGESAAHTATLNSKLRISSSEMRIIVGVEEHWRAIRREVSKQTEETEPETEPQTPLSLSLAQSKAPARASSPEELPKGVTRRPSGAWQAQIYYAGKTRYIGVWDEPHQAARAYNLAREALGDLKEKLGKAAPGPQPHKAADKGTGRDSRKRKSGSSKSGNCKSKSKSNPHDLDPSSATRAARAATGPPRASGGRAASSPAPSLAASSSLSLSTSASSSLSLSTSASASTPTSLSPTAASPDHTGTTKQASSSPEQGPFKKRRVVVVDREKEPPPGPGEGAASALARAASAAPSATATEHALSHRILPGKASLAAPVSAFSSHHPSAWASRSRAVPLRGERHLAQAPPSVPIGRGAGSTQPSNTGSSNSGSNSSSNNNNNKKNHHTSEKTGGPLHHPGQDLPVAQRPPPPATVQVVHPPPVPAFWPPIPYVLGPHPHAGVGLRASYHLRHPPVVVGHPKPKPGKVPHQQQNQQQHHHRGPPPGHYSPYTSATQPRPVVPRGPAGGAVQRKQAAPHAVAPFRGNNKSTGTITSTSTSTDPKGRGKTNNGARNCERHETSRNPTGSEGLSKQRAAENETWKAIRTEVLCVFAEKRKRRAEKAAGTHQGNEPAPAGTNPTNGNEHQHKHEHKPAKAFDKDVLRGITVRPSGKFQAQLYFGGRSRYIGVFDTQHEAASAYEMVREKIKKATLPPKGRAAAAAAAGPTTDAAVVSPLNQLLSAATSLSGHPGTTTTRTAPNAAASATTTTTLRSITPSPTPRGDGTREAARGLALAPAPRE